MTETGRVDHLKPVNVTQIIDPPWTPDWEQKSVASRRMSRGRGWQSYVGRTSDWKFRWGGNRKGALSKSIRKCTMLQPPRVYRPLRWPGKGEETDKEEKRETAREREKDVTGE